MENLQLTPTDFVALTNQTLEYAYPSVTVVGEVSGFKINQDKFVFFDIKDEATSVGCFMMKFQLSVAIEDGMQIAITAQPKLTNKGKFSLTVRSIQPVGEGSLKRSFELLKAKLEKEGLFAQERKRPLPELPAHIGVISSIDAAGYADFIKILDERWGGVSITVVHTQVQGLGAPQQIIGALQHFNEAAEPPEVVVIVRGGGSLDDLSAFNDELLVRAIVSSRLPVLTGIGHETDISLADLAADVYASTPSNAAQLVVPDKKQFTQALYATLHRAASRVEHIYTDRQQKVEVSMRTIVHSVSVQFDMVANQYNSLSRSLSQLNPRNVLKRGYSLVRLQNNQSLQQAKIGDLLEIETSKSIIQAGVKNVSSK